MIWVKQRIAPRINECQKRLGKTASFKHNKNDLTSRTQLKTFHIQLFVDGKRSAKASALAVHVMDDTDHVVCVVSAVWKQKHKTETTRFSNYLKIPVRRTEAVLEWISPIATLETELEQNDLTQFGGLSAKTTVLAGTSEIRATTSREGSSKTNFSASTRYRHKIK